MSKQEFLTHWVIGLVATAVWFWGKQWGLPPAAIDLAAATVPSLMAHALGRTREAGTAPKPPEQPGDTQ